MDNVSSGMICGMQQPQQNSYNPLLDYNVIGQFSCSSTGLDSQAMLMMLSQSCRTNNISSSNSTR